jgi:hypothetical protein
MRLPSLQHLAAEARNSFTRFPFVILAAAVAAAAGVVAIENDHASTLVKIMASAQLGLPLFFALAVAGESFRWSRAVRAGGVLAGIAALIGYYFTLPDWMSPGAITRFIQFNAGLHLAVAFAPFAARGLLNGFWQYNKALFLRFLQSALYTVVVFAGLSIALVAIDQLLGVRVDDSVYARLWTVCALLLNTWLFVGGVPRDVRGLEAVGDYPRALKVFAQYILIPLVVVYLAILTIYLFKVIVTTQWPSGWIGYLVSSVAVVGILALLLVWPASERGDDRWVATYTRWFFIFMIPAIAMLLMAVYKRIEQYGVTENRYFLAALSLWLAAIALYFIFSRRRSIKLIPATLCAIAFVTCFGPWGAYSVARHSQTGRLQALLEANHILVDGAIREAPGEVSFEDRREISAVTTYLVKHHGVETLEPWFGAERLAEVDSALLEEAGRGNRHARRLVSSMGLEYVEGWRRTIADEGRFNYSLDRDETVLDVGGADYLVKLRPPGTARAIDETGYSLSWVDTVGVVVSDGSGVVIAAPIDSVFTAVDLNQLLDTSRMPASVMHVAVSNDRARLTVYFNHVSGQRQDGVRSVTHYDADCFLSLASPRQ